MSQVLATTHHRNEGQSDLGMIFHWEKDEVKFAFYATALFQQPQPALSAESL